MRSPARQAEQYPHEPARKPTPTRWPIVQPWTPSPSASIRPITSWPGTRGQEIGNVPATVPALMQRQERQVEVGPHRVAREVGELGLGPGRFERMPSEGRPGCGQLFEDLSLRILDGDAIGAEPCAPIVGSERLMGRPFLAEPNSHSGPFEFAELTFQ